MRVDLITREYPPFVYGGAGVHVTELAKVLRPRVDEVHVHAFDGTRNPQDIANAGHVYGYDYPQNLSKANGALKTLGLDVEIVQRVDGADIVHSHTWYANMAGHLAQILYDIPHVISAHSLEPLRPWKAEQLGGGYRLSSWMEKTAYEDAAAIVAVSYAMRDDILRCYPGIDPDKVKVIHNGIDLDDWSVVDDDEAVKATLKKYGIDPHRPTAVFVGRITRQKGLPHLLRALQTMPKDAQMVLCAGAPDTEEIMTEVTQLVDQLRSTRSTDGIIWISEMLPHEEVVHILQAATLFVTPSIYEPLGIVNLEAMAMGLPVVGTNTGGIPDCIVDEETGLLVPIEQKDDGSGTPLDAQAFEADMGQRINALLNNPEKAREMGKAGRKRVEDQFTWSRIGDEVVELYQTMLE
ncbi:MAG: glycogen synthase [Actinomycetaceae bacterium]|nr:glycogen synthase [Actinomycetaceae bacterium]